VVSPRAADEHAFRALARELDPRVQRRQAARAAIAA
jgi:hypothetical protein